MTYEPLFLDHERLKTIHPALANPRATTTFQPKQLHCSTQNTQISGRITQQQARDSAVRKHTRCMLRSGWVHHHSLMTDI